MKSRKIIKTSLIVLSLFFIVGCTHSADPTEQTTSNKETVPDLTFKNYKQKQVNLREFDKPTIINSWAGWCGFCKKELKDFAKAQKEFGDEVEIIAINRGESKQKALGYTNDLGVTDDLTFLIDTQDKFYRKINGFAMPETIFVDSNGNVKFHKRGPMDFNEIKSKTEKFLLD